METIRFLGITFRSGSHLVHFFITMPVFVFFLIYFLHEARKGTDRILPGLCLFLGVNASITALTAVSKTEWGTINGPVFSVDCIWYNGLLAVGYFTMAITCIILNRKLKNKNLLKTAG